MKKFEDVKEMGLGDLVLALVNLDKEFKADLADVNAPYTESYDKYGGVAGYNAQLNNDYQKRQKDLVKELNIRGRM